MHLFGLTGGIASGKSTVAARLRALGVPLIDADELAREVLSPGSEGLRQVAQVFGGEVLDASGALDRKALGRRIFVNEAERRKLNAITHPRIAALSLQRANELARAGQPLACYEAALIVENGGADAFRPLIVCACPEEMQAARLQSRERISQQEALSRIRAQKPTAEKVAVADYVIDTSGSLEENARQTDDVLRRICAQLGVDLTRYIPSLSP